MQNPTEEVFDLVDTNDNVIGSTVASKANTDPSVIHREVAIIIYDKNNKILLQKRNQNMRIAPGIWTVSCAGHVTSGFSPLEMAHQELKEELGFDTDLKFIEKTLDKQSNETRFIYWYKGMFPKDAKIKIEADEVADAKFVDKENIENFQKDGNVIGDISLDQIFKYWSGC